MDCVAFQAVDNKWLDVIKTDFNFLPLMTIMRCFFNIHLEQVILRPNYNIIVVCLFALSEWFVAPKVL